jgi:hypothetical protein
MDVFSEKKGSSCGGAEKKVSLLFLQERGGENKIKGEELVSSFFYKILFFYTNRVQIYIYVRAYRDAYICI